MPSLSADIFALVSHSQKLDGAPVSAPTKWRKITDSFPFLNNWTCSTARQKNHIQSRLRAKWSKHILERDNRPTFAPLKTILCNQPNILKFTIKCSSTLFSHLYCL